MTAEPDASGVPSPAYEQLPGVSGWPIVGSIPRFTRDPLGFITQLRRKHGPVARFRMAGLPYVLLSDPEGIEQVLVRQHTSFQKHDYLRMSLGDALGDGLLVAEGEDWMTQRQLAQPNFRPKRIRGYAPAMRDQTERIVEAWRTQPERELHTDMTLLTLRIVAEALFDVSVDAQADAIGEALDDVMARFSADNRLLTLLPKSVPLPINRRYHRGVTRVRGIVEDLIDDRARDPAGEDLMSRMIRAYQAHEAGLDRDRLRDELVTFLVAGHETTALTLTWTLWLLGTHPEQQTRLHEELDTLETPIEPAALDELPFLDAVVDESMRLLPAVWAFGRQAIEDVEIAGRPLPKGTQIMMSQWVVQRDPEVWGQPERFDPDRWLDGRADETHRFAHFPFGGGPRTCIGDSFALLEAKLCLAALLSRFEVHAVDAERPALDPSITLRPAEPVKMRVEERPS